MNGCAYTPITTVKITSTAVGIIMPRYGLMAGRSLPGAPQNA